MVHFPMEALWKEGAGLASILKMQKVQQKCRTLDLTIMGMSCFKQECIISLRVIVCVFLLF